MQSSIGESPDSHGERSVKREGEFMVWDKATKEKCMNYPVKVGPGGGGHTGEIENWQTRNIVGWNGKAGLGCCRWGGCEVVQTGGELKNHARRCLYLS